MRAKKNYKKLTSDKRERLQHLIVSAKKPGYELMQKKDRSLIEQISIFQDDCSDNGWVMYDTELADKLIILIAEKVDLIESKSRKGQLIEFWQFLMSLRGRNAVVNLSQEIRSNPSNGLSESILAQLSFATDLKVPEGISLGHHLPQDTLDLKSFIPQDPFGSKRSFPQDPLGSKRSFPQDTAKSVIWKDHNLNLKGAIDTQTFGSTVATGTQSEFNKDKIHGYTAQLEKRQSEINKEAKNKLSQITIEAEKLLNQIAREDAKSVNKLQTKLEDHLASLTSHTEAEQLRISRELKNDINQHNSSMLEDAVKQFHEQTSSQAKSVEQQVQQLSEQVTKEVDNFVELNAELRKSLAYIASDKLADSSKKQANQERTTANWLRGFGVFWLLMTIWYFIYHGFDMNEYLDAEGSPMYTMLIMRGFFRCLLLYTWFLYAARVGSPPN